MTKKVSQEIIDSYKEMGEAHPLVEPRQNPGVDKELSIMLPLVKPHGVFEITLNYPRTASFIKKLSGEQQRMYIKMWDILKCSCGMPMASGVKFEYCKSGHVHLHGYLIPSMTTYYIIGYISDLVKSYLRMLPKKYQQYNEKCMFSGYYRYRSPSICVQYNDDPERFKTWYNYIHKDCLKPDEKK